MSWSLLIFVMVGQFWPSGGQKHLKRGVIRAPNQRKVFRTFCTCFEVSVWNLAYTLSRWCHFTTKSRSKPLICIHGLRNYIKASDVLHILKWWVSWPQLIFVISSGGQKHSKGGVSRAPSQRHIRFEFHHNQVSASEEFSGLFSKCFAVSSWKLVYTLHR